MDNTINFSALLSAGWQSFKQEWKLIYVTFFMVIFISSIFSFFPQFLFSSLPEESVFMIVVSIITFFLNIFISTWLEAGKTNVFLKIAGNQGATLADLLNKRSVVLKLLGAKLLVSLVSFLIAGVVGLLGFILFFARVWTIGISNYQLTTSDAFFIGISVLVFLIVSMYVFTRIQFYSYFIVDKDFGPVESLAASWNITKGKVSTLIGIGIGLFLIGLLGLLAFVVGLLIAVPVVTLAHYHLYLRLIDTPTKTIPNGEIA